MAGLKDWIDAGTVDYEALCLGVRPGSRMIAQTGGDAMTASYYAVRALKELDDLDESDDTPSFCAEVPTTAEERNLFGLSANTVYIWPSWSGLRFSESKPASDDIGDKPESAITDDPINVWQSTEFASLVRKER